LRHYVADLVSRGKNPSRAAQVRAVMADVIPELLGMPLSVVDARALYRFRDRRERAGIKANTIIRDLRVLRAMLKKARPDFTVPADVFPPENLIRVRMFSPEDEARALSTDGPEPFQTMERLAPLTLIRQGNLRMLRRDQVHLEQALILLPRTKGGPRAVALGDEAVALLRRQLARHPSDWVFPNPRTGQPYSRVHVSRVWRQRLRALGIYQRTGGFTWHDLKHHGAMVGLAEGASFPELQAAGGWQSPTMVNRYATASSARLRDLQNRQSARRAAQGAAEPSPPSPR
jgi:integrase